MSWWRREPSRRPNGNGHGNGMDQTLSANRRIWSDTFNRIQRSAEEAERIALASQKTSDRGLSELMDFMGRSR